MRHISKNNYEKLHYKNLIPIDIKINVDDFIKDISKYTHWHRWGDKFNELERYGLPLVNLNGKLYNEDEPACWPLDRWNFVNKNYEDTPEEWIKFYKDVLDDRADDFLLDYHFDKPTSLLNIKSLSPLVKIHKYLRRSCILKWNAGGLFYPHVDTWHPVRWLRLWGCSNPENIKLRFKSNDGEKHWNGIKKEYEYYKPWDNIEPGRLYLINTLQWHDAIASDTVYQFFIALDIDYAKIINFG
mgnify:CR=1 FL=1